MKQTLLHWKIYHCLVSEEKEEEPEDAGLDDWEAMASDEEREKGKFLKKNGILQGMWECVCFH